LQDWQRRLQERDIGHTPGFLPPCTNPVAIGVALDFLPAQFFDIGLSKSSKAGKDKKIFDLVESVKGGGKFHQSGELFLIEIGAFNLFERKADVEEGVFLHPSISQAKVGDLFEILEELGGGVESTAAIGFQIEAELGDHVMVNHLDGDIIGLVVLFKELLEVIPGSFVSDLANQLRFLTDQFDHSFQVFLPDLQDHPGFGRIHALNSIL